MFENVLQLVHYNSVLLNMFLLNIHCFSTKLMYALIKLDSYKKMSIVMITMETNIQFCERFYYRSYLRVNIS